MTLSPINRTELHIFKNLFVIGDLLNLRIKYARITKIPYRR